MWLWIVGILSLLVIWVGGLLLSLFGVTVPLWLQLLLTAIVILSVVGTLLFRRWRARARAQALEREIIKQTEQQVANTRPDRRAEIVELQRQMLQGLQALKQTRLGAKHGSRALYVLPWYAIIGPPGAGKTTALRHSGLVFPVAQGGGGASVKGVGGTRNCDWWFTNEAILLDTAGRYATEQDDRDEWFAFLEMLRRHRPDKPINGLILAVSIADLIQASEEQISDIAQRLRARIDEIIVRLGMVLPVYLMFTKVDLVGGFVEYWGDLRRSERDQVLGATLSVDVASSAVLRQRFEEEFQAITDNLKGRALDVITKERQPEARQRIYQFPLEFADLRENLTSFVAQVFQRNMFQETPIFRGFYFTSGTQEGRPFDKVIGGMARAFGLRPPVGGAATTEPKSYFVTDLFRRVVFPDQHLAGRTEAELRRQWLTRWAIAGSCLLITAILLIPALLSFGNNRGLIKDSASRGKDAITVGWDRAGKNPEEIAKMEGLLAQLRQLETWDEEGAPMSLRWGLYEGNTMHPALRDTYVRSFNAGVGRPSKRQIETELRDRSAMRATSPTQFKPHYDLLKLYIMLGTPKRLEVPWAAEHLVEVWAKTQSGGAAAQQRLLPIATYYLELMKREEVPPWELDDSAVSRSRAVLSRAPRLERMYEILVREANSEIPPIKREDIFYGTVAQFVKGDKDVQVEGAYTRGGWERVREVLGVQRSKLSDESWVLGEGVKQAEADIDKQVAKLRGLYFDRFKSAWRKFLADLVVERPETRETSGDELSALSEPVWPYLRLIRTLHENVTLDMGSGDGVQDKIAEGVVAQAKKVVGRKLGTTIKTEAKPKAKRERSPVERAFQPLTKFGIPPDSAADSDSPPPTGLSQYIEILGQLVGVLTDMRDSDPAPTPEDVSAEFEKAFRATSQLLLSQDAFTRPLLSPLLLRPISGAWQGVVSDAGGATSGLWEATVWDKWNASLAGRYPFEASPKDAKVEDFTEFFRPGSGLLWSFFSEHLDGAIHRSGDDFAARRRFQSGMSFSGPFLTNCLSRGAKISEAFFPGGAEEPAIGFDINLHSVSESVSEVQLEIDGVSQVYRNTPEEWLHASWPAEGERRGARVRVRGYRELDEVLERAGDFGFFRLLDAADEIASGTAGGRPDGAPVLVAKWSLRSQGAFFMLDIRPERTDAPISTSLFDGYRCPRSIVSGSPR